MTYFFIKVYSRYARWTIGIWTFFTLIDFLVSKLFAEHVTTLCSLLGFVAATVCVSSVMNSTRWIVLCRRTSATIRHFWIMILGVLFLSLVLNGLCYLVSIFINGVDSSFEFFDINFLDIVWLILIAYSLSLSVIFDVKESLLNRSLKPVKNLVLFFSFYAWLAIVGPLFMFSRLIMYGFVETSLLVFFFTQNKFVMSSIYKPMRLRSIYAGLIGVLALMVISYQIEIKTTTAPSKFLGFLVHQSLSKQWLFSDLQSVDRPSTWIAWLKSGPDLDTDQTVQSLIKLESICPALPTDSPAVIVCHEKKTKTQVISLSGTSADAEILKFLDSSNQYVKLYGLIEARHMDVFSPALAKKIEELQHSPGRLSPVAEKTLASHHKGYKGGVKVDLYSEN